jgi:hypothetical protein
MADEEFKDVFDRVVNKAIRAKDMKVLGALGLVKRALKSRDYTTTDKGYIKAVLFPEKSKGAKIPSIYPTFTNSCQQSSKFEVIVNENGFFAVAMNPENASNLFPVFYEFNRGSLDDWGVPRHLRLDGTQLSRKRDERDTNSRVSDRKDASLVFDNARIVGASLTAYIQKKQDDIYGSLEGALETNMKLSDIEFVNGASPEDVTSLLMAQYDAIGSLSFREPDVENGPLVDKIRYIRFDREDGGLFSFISNTVANFFTATTKRTVVPGTIQQYVETVVSASLSDTTAEAKVNFESFLKFIANKKLACSSVRLEKSMNAASFRTLYGLRPNESANEYVVALGEMKLLDILESVGFLIYTKLKQVESGLYDKLDFSFYAITMMEVVVTGLSQRQRDFVKQRLSELINVRTVPVKSMNFESDRIRGLSFYSEAHASAGLRVLYVPTKAEELVPIHSGTTPSSMLYIFGHGIEPKTRVVIECARVFETQTNLRFREYIVPTKAVPDPRSLTLINYIHTTARWILHVPPRILDGLYGEMKGSLGHFDLALQGFGSSIPSIAEIQESNQRTEDAEKLEN